MNRSCRGLNLYVPVPLTSQTIPVSPCTRWSFSLQWRDESRALIGGGGFIFVYSGSI